MKHFTEEIVSILREKIPGAVIETREVVKSGERCLTGICTSSFRSCASWSFM